MVQREERYDSDVKIYIYFFIVEWFLIIYTMCEKREVSMVVGQFLIPSSVSAVSEARCVVREEKFSPRISLLGPVYTFHHEGCNCGIFQCKLIL